MLAFGVQHLIYAGYGVGLGPPWVLVPPAWAILTGLIFVISAVAMLAAFKPRVAALLLAVMLFVLFVGQRLTRLLPHLHDPGPWTSAAEVLCLCGGALIVAGTFPAERPPLIRDDKAVSKIIVLGRYIFALPLIVFGVQHYLYAQFVATLVPAWIPARLFWAYFVGVAFCATALAVVTQIRARTATFLLGLMFFLWVLIVHAPRVAAASHNGNEWTSLVVALAMCGSSWALAGSLSERPVRAPLFSRAELSNH
jgi:uncharacterized membrane protein